MDIVAASVSMQKVAEMIERVASADVNVLLLGESGTGKDFIARVIHDRGPRHSNPFVNIDCASLPEELLESELFGYEKGAFTGATESKPGRFENANQGTLVLGDIASLSSSAQAKLLRVIEERSFERLGGKHLIKIDVRIIAVANVDLREAVRARTFRDDLYYRLNVVTITIPPLRDRVEDIPELAEGFLNHFASRAGHPGIRLTREALDALGNYDYPGNARELRNIIEKSVLTAGGDNIGARHMPEYLRSATRLMRSDRHKPSLAELEAVYIQEVLDHSRGNKTRAANILGISRKNLYEKMRRYQIKGFTPRSTAIALDNENGKGD